MFSQQWLKEELDQLEQEKERLNRNLSKAPEGDLILRKDRKYNKWYQRIHRGKEDQWIYLKRSEQPMIKKLALKKYYQSRLKDVDFQLALGRRLEKEFVNQPDAAYQWISKPEISQILGREDLQQWAKAPYVRKEKYQSGQIHEYSRDVAFRSKSEEMIALALDKYQIPYHYEEGIEVAGEILYPDFVIRHPVTGRVYIWEHLGMMDDDQYRGDVMWKMSKYLQAGYTPMLDLIFTSETRKEPLTYRKIEEIIRMFFL